MATATQLASLFVPEVYDDYIFQQTAVKNKLVESNVLQRSSFLDEFLMGGGNTVDMPFHKDLARTGSNVSSDDDASSSTATAITGSYVRQHRLSRNKSWTSTDLVANITGNDPLTAMADRVAAWWAWDLQNTTLATLKGVFADNAAAPSGSEHVPNDMTVDVKGTTFTLGSTNFTAENLLAALATMGDSMYDLNTIWCHSVIYNRMRTNDLIDFIPDSEGKSTIPTYQGMRVIFDDAMPASAGVFETYILGSGALQLGMGLPKTPSEWYRDPAKGNGGGTETFYSRQQWVIAPAGTSYVGTATVGGASNTTLEAAASWQRAYPERKQIPIARLITREY